MAPPSECGPVGKGQASREATSQIIENVFVWRSGKVGYGVSEGATPGPGTGSAAGRQPPQCPHPWARLLWSLPPPNLCSLDNQALKMFRKYPHPQAMPAALSGRGRSNEWATERRSFTPTAACSRTRQVSEGEGLGFHHRSG